MEDFRLKGLFFLLLVGMLLNACKNHTELEKSNSTFFIVQPAEHFQAFNGHLNSYGRKRAEALKDFLRDSSIERIYTNTISYSRETMLPLKKLYDLNTIVYPLDSMVDKLYQLLVQNKDLGRRILIVSPEEKINPLLEKLGRSSESFIDAKNKFNEIYRLENDRGKTTLKTLTYGDMPRPVFDSSSVPLSEEKAL